MAEAIFDADRGYNTKQTLQFVGDVLGASIIGTQKRDLTCPYVFGSGPITKRAKGMVVSEKGCKAVYIATKKTEGTTRRVGRDLEACLYRKSCSGRIAAMIHNDRKLFKSPSFTIVPHNRFRSSCSLDAIQEEQVVYDSQKRGRGGAMHTILHLSSPATLTAAMNGARLVDQLIHRVKVLTFQQSEDPVWFLLCAFRFTSRTGHAFLSTITRDFEKNMESLGWQLRGKSLATGSGALTSDHAICVCLLKSKCERVCRMLGIQLRALPQQSARRDLAQRITRYSRSRIQSFNRSDLHQMLGVFGRGMVRSPAKAVLVTVLLQLQTDIIAGTVDLNETEEEPAPMEARATESVSTLLLCLHEASVHSWVMKPLVSTAGMKEGSRNEIEVLRAIPKFLMENKGAYAQSSTVETVVTYSYRAEKELTVQLIRSLGLIESKSSPMIADSPDALLACTDELEQSFACAA